MVQSYKNLKVHNNAVFKASNTALFVAGLKTQLKQL